MQEQQPCRGFGHIAFKHFAFVIHCSTEIMHLSIVHLIEIPPPMAKAMHRIQALPSDVTGEQRTEPVSPEADGFIGDVDPVREKQVFHVPQRQQEVDIQHHHEADHLGR
jgi:hypothetical protein